MKQRKRHKKLLSEVQRVLKTVKDREVISELKEVQIAFTDVDGEGVVLSMSINKKGKIKRHYDILVWKTLKTSYMMHLHMGF